ncbi:MAG: class I SAM-dependent methyltransferase [Proteobacteria bacterium]|nr:class I SAM-dependent methyltransferase [Pseudomonadota bacterium]
MTGKDSTHPASPIDVPANVQHNAVAPTLADLLREHGATFVAAAWRTLLQREPDLATAAAWAAEMEHGRMDRLDVVIALADSAEGRARAVELEGLAAARRRRAWGRWPVVGPLARRLHALWQLPAVALRVHALEQQMDRAQHATTRLGDAATHADHRFTQLDEGLHAAAGTATAAAAAAASAAAAVAAAQVQQQHAQRELADRFATQLAVHNEAQRAARDAQDSAAKHVRTRIDAITAAMQDAFGVVLPRAELEAFYVRFEDRFRGPRDEIKARATTHLTAVKAAIGRVPSGAGGVLDIGAGRGEWLELLAEHGIPARGIDHSAAMVAACRAAGLHVDEADALAHLAAVPPRSLAAITVFHVVEHLPFTSLVALVQHAHAALAPGGCLVVETPNPENLRVGACYFYLDPTHRHPLPPDVLRFVLEDRGFADVDVQRLHAMPGALRLPGDGTALATALDAILSGPQDYAVTGMRPLASAAGNARNG